MRRALALLLLIGSLAGCAESARHVVVDPKSTAGLATADWTVKREPAPAPSPAIP